MPKSKSKTGVPVIEHAQLDSAIRYVANFRPEEVLVAGDIQRSDFERLIGPNLWT